MKLEVAQYIEVDFFGMILLFIMSVHTMGIHYEVYRKEQKYFNKMLMTNMIILFSDVVSCVAKFSSQHIFIIINHIACIVFFVLHTYFGYVWLMYTLKRLYPEYVPKKMIYVAMGIPSILNLLIVIASPMTKWIYIISDSNHYIRGRYLWVTLALSFLYWIMSGSIIIREMIVKTRIREVSVYISLLIFPLPTFIGQVIQMSYPGISLVWICSAFSILILFINLQNDQISRDMLTGLFNRRQTNKQISWEIKHLTDANYLLFLIMIDVDKFKKINDELGHVVGDRALTTVSDILRASFRKRDFIGRFGGDEFMIIGHVKSKLDVDKLLDKMRGEVRKFNDEGHEYNISLSAGVQVYKNSDIITADSMITAADKEMYREKNSHKGAVRC